MGRDTLELAFDSLFIEKIRNTFKPVDANLLNKGCAFSEEKAAGIDIKSFQAAELLFNQDADAITVAGALLAPLLWSGQVEPSEIPIHFGQALDATLNESSSPFFLRVDSEHHRRKDIHTLLASLGRFRSRLHDHDGKGGEYNNRRGIDDDM